jgi:uncharacterized protein
MWYDVALFAVVGFAAQVIDGALGMAYGVSATTVLLTFGVAPSVASASVHAAEVFTTGVSGIAHWQLGNVDRKLLIRLAVPGAIGGAVGVYLLIDLPGSVIRPFVSAYLMIMGALILWRALQPRLRRAGNIASALPPRFVVPLGITGGVFDAIGGGGWGAVVTSTLIGRGVAPRLAIGSPNCAEFFVACMVTANFGASTGLDLWPMIAGLIGGGMLAAPLAALLTRSVDNRRLMFLIGVVITLLSVRDLLHGLL